MVVKVFRNVYGMVMVGSSSIVELVVVVATIVHGSYKIACERSFDKSVV